MNFKKLFKLPDPPRTHNFTVDCTRYQVTPFTAWSLADELSLKPIRKGNQVTFTPMGDTDAERANWIAIYFLKLGHEKRATKL